MFAGDGGGGRRKGVGGGAHGKGKGGRRGQQGRGGKGANEDGGGSAAATGVNGSSAKAAEGGTSEVICYRCGKKGHWKVDCAGELCSRCHGRGHAAGVCPTSKEEAVLAASDGRGFSFQGRRGRRVSDALGIKGKGGRLGR